MTIKADLVTPYAWKALGCEWNDVNLTDSLLLPDAHCSVKVCSALMLLPGFSLPHNCPGSGAPCISGCLRSRSRGRRQGCSHSH